MGSQVTGQPDRVRKLAYECDVESVRVGEPAGLLFEVGLALVYLEFPHFLRR